VDEGLGEREAEVAEGEEVVAAQDEVAEEGEADGEGELPGGELVKLADDLVVVERAEAIVEEPDGHGEKEEAEERAEKRAEAFEQRQAPGFRPQTSGLRLQAQQKQKKRRPPAMLGASKEKTTRAL
jgi:hypothetical protein